MTTQILDLNNIERKIFWILAAFIGATIAFYLYSVLALTVAGVDRDRLSRASHDLATKAGDFEAEYLSHSNAVTLARAHELGFREVDAKFAGLSATAVATEITVPKISMAR